MHCGLSAETATLGVNMVCGVLLMIPLYFIARAFWGRGGALWCCTLGVVFPPLVRFSCTRLREAIYYLFVFTAFAFFLYAARRIKPVLNSFLCGVMCVCAVFSRYEAFELFIILPSGLLLAAFFPEKRVLPCVKSIIAFLFGAAVFMLIFKLLPGMPDIITIFWNKIYSICLGTFINPV
jgi:4-amino-4-deoxy-L-arabinose transferase-like glycosyltransferase